MAFIVVNAQDALTYKDVLDQAEPDAVDFEVLGNLGTNFVVTGGAVTTNSSAVNVAVAAGTVVIQGHVYSFGANATLSIPAAPVNKRFDLVVARLSGGTVSLTVPKGPDSSTNPTLPVSRSVTSLTYDGTTMYDPATDVVLACLYRPAGGTVTSTRILDKRVFSSNVISVQSASAPTATPGTPQAGVLNYKTGTPSGSSTGVYVGDQNGNWTEFAANANGPQVPIGGSLVWPSRGAVPANFGECNGQSLSTTTYAALFALLGYDYGGSGANFNLPNYNDYVIKGTTQTASGQVDSPGATKGADTLSIAIGNLPVHDHSLNSHTHTLVHQHGIDHDHPSGSTGFESSSHVHGPLSGTFFLNEDTSGGTFGFAATAGSETVYRNASTSGNASGHFHSFDVANYSGSTSSQNATTTSGAIGNTQSTGSGTAISTVQKSMYARWIIRLL